MKIFEILVPTMMHQADSKGNVFWDKQQIPARVAHHRKWDAFVMKLTGGLSIFSPIRGKWANKNKVYEERMIPVKIACTDEQMTNIVDFTMSHYRQKAIMYYLISETVFIKENKECVA